MAPPAGGVPHLTRSIAPSQLLASAARGRPAGWGEAEGDREEGDAAARGAHGERQVRKPTWSEPVETSPRPRVPTM
jgi:hypothetical protein